MKTNFQKQQSSAQRGFTLVEIAIVLLIIGLLIGGILRGQELITSARVRNMMDQKASLQAADISFMDRYKMKAGDLTNLQAGIVGMGALESLPFGGSAAGDGLITVGSEGVLVFQNLAATGFISCGSCMTVTTNAAHSINNSPVNPFGDFVQTGRTTPVTANVAGIWWNLPIVAPNVAPFRNFLTTGGTVGSQVMAELDRKADDGFPGAGSLRLSSTGATVAASCAPNLVGATTNALVAAAFWANPSFDNCAGAWLL